MILVAMLLVLPAAAPLPMGRLVDLGGRHLHVDCVGRGRPTVVVETGFYEFSFDWTLVQSRLSRAARVCTYDRAGYAWSDPGPEPRTLDQIDLELRTALERLGEPPPYLLVGHSFGGSVVRQFALTYPREVAGLVLVDAIQEDERIVIDRRAVRLRSFASGRAIPPPHLAGPPREMPVPLPPQPPPAKSVEPPLDRLPAWAQRLHLWAQSQLRLEVAQGGERDWSPEYFARWAQASQDGSLGNLPLMVLTRAVGGYGSDLDAPAAELEAERRERQARLARLSTRGRLEVVPAGHDMHLEAPDVVCRAVQEVMDAVRSPSARPGQAVGPLPRRDASGDRQ